MRRGTKLSLAVLAIVLLLALLVVGGAFLKRFVLEPREAVNPRVGIFDTELSSSFRDIANRLESEGYVRSGEAFRLLARYRGKDKAIKAGEYELSSAMTPQEILDKMARGEMLLRRVTIKEGATIVDIAKALEQAGIVDAGSFRDAAYDREILNELKISADSLEGYLFPETYQFRRKTSAKQVVRAMHDQLIKRWPDDWTQRASLLQLTQHQILTLASIIEKESGNFDEQPVISSVFHNRMRLKMRFQSDPTVIYGIKDFNGNITRRDLQTLTPYNTYMIDGFPPGPIANPGINAIRSALYPTDTKFLYFVGNGEGRHIFSEDLAQHNNAVNRYQRGGSGGGGGGAFDQDGAQ